MKRAGNITIFSSLIIFLLAELSCHPKPSQPDALIVAVAANLSGIFQELSRDYEKLTGSHLTLSIGATLSLAQQLRHGAPFDLFVSADKETPLRLSKEGHLIPKTVKVYARGRLVVWVPTSKNTSVEKLEDLLRSKVVHIGIASPQIAPYGKRAQESLEALGLWKKLLPKIVFGGHVKQVQQYAVSRNVEAAFLPLSLVPSIGGQFFLVDEQLYSPLDQALGVVTSSHNQEKAQQLADFVLSTQGQAFLKQAGYHTEEKVNP